MGLWCASEDFLGGHLIPFPVLGPIIILCCVIGAYSIRFLMFDVWITLVFGVIGYLSSSSTGPSPRSSWPSPPSIIRGIWIQFRSHAPEVAIDESDD